MKKILILIAAIVFFAIILSACGSSDELTLNVYNWGEYISDGSEGSFDTIREFENWYEETYGQAVKVNYDTYASNEDMYNKISSGAVSYDVIIPSDYMVAKMIDEEMLHEVGQRFRRIVTVENGVVKGGLGSAVLEFMADHGYTPQVRRIGVPDRFIGHGSIPELNRVCGMDAESIAESLCGWNDGDRI